MQAERKVLLVDLGVGVAAILGGLIAVSPSAIDLWWAGALAAVATVALTWSEEHGVIGGWATIALVVGFGLAFIGIGLVFGSSAVADATLPVVLVGLGVGMIAYRCYFGLVRPIPDRRLGRVGKQVV